MLLVVLLLASSPATLAFDHRVTTGAASPPADAQWANNQEENHNHNHNHNNIQQPSSIDGNTARQEAFPVRIEHSIDSGQNWRLLGVVRDTERGQKASTNIGFGARTAQLERAAIGVPSVAELRAALAAGHDYRVRVAADNKDGEEGEEGKEGKSKSRSVASAPLCHVWHDARRATLTVHVDNNGFVIFLFII